jgi:general secretion pathway protein I
MREAKRRHGFTLIEVLVAMVVLSVGFLAVFKASAQSLHTVNAVQERQIQHWICMQAMNAIIAGTIKIQNSNNEIFNKTNMLGKDWRWHAFLKDTEVASIKQITVETDEGGQVVGFIVQPIGKGR